MSSAVHASCDALSARTAAPGQDTPHRGFVLAACILASSLAFVDGSVVNVGLATIGSSLGADAASLQWVVNAYLLPLSALLLLGGAAGDRFGRRRLLIAGTALFALASLVCALAPDLGWLLAGRLLQGTSAALVMPNSLAILGQSFPGDARGRAIGIWAATGAAMGAVGPVLGGWLMDVAGWRAIFLLNLPLAAGAVLLASRFVQRSVDDGEETLDAAGGFLATAGLAALTWALTVGSGKGGWTMVTTVASIGAAGLLTAFVVVERRRGSRAMMPLALFASRSFVGLTLLTLLLYGALGGLFVLIPYVLIEAGGYDGTAAGAALLPMPLLLSALSPLMGGVAGRIGPRMPLTIGPIIVAVGLLLATRIGATPGYWTEIMPAVAVMALGMSGAVAPLTAAVLNSVDARHAGSASGFNSAAARTGGLIATALLGRVLSSDGEALVYAFHVSLFVAAGACFAASACAFWLIDRPGRRVNRPDQP